MALNPIGDIANPTLSEVVAGEVTWETAGDWDGAVSETGVVHEAIGDITAADEVRLGYPSSLFSALQAYWTFDESSDPFVDVVNGFDASVFGGDPTEDFTAIAGTTGISFDGNSDEVNASHNSALRARDAGFTVALWFRTSANQDNTPMMAKWGDGDNEWLLTQSYLNAGRIIFTAYDTDNVAAETASTYGDDNWHLAIGGYDGSNARIVIDPGEGEDVTGDAGGTLNTTTADIRWGRYSVTGSGSNFFAGRLDAPMYFDKWLSSTEREALYAAGNGGGSITTDTKSFGADVQPDITDAVYTLNGQSISLDIIGSPGTGSEETVTQSLDGSSSYTLTWSSAHTDFRIKPTFDTTDKTVTPTLSKVTLST